MLLLGSRVPSAVREYCFISLDWPGARPVPERTSTAVSARWNDVVWYLVRIT
jgi:hypothetical protein